MAINQLKATGSKDNSPVKLNEGGNTQQSQLIGGAFCSNQLNHHYMESGSDGRVNKRTASLVTEDLDQK